MADTITQASDSRERVEQNARRPRRLPSNAQLDAARVMNTAPGRLRYLDGFGDATPPDRRPLARVMPLRGPRR